MRILAVTNIYPSKSMPANGVFVAEQVRGMKAIGLEVEVVFVDRVSKGMGAYYSMIAPIRDLMNTFAPDVLHVMYGGVMAERVTRKLNHVPRIVTFHGSDLLGENLSGIRRKLVSRYGVLCSWRAAKRAEGVVVVSNRLKVSLPKGLDARKIRVIPCGIDLARFRCLDRGECRRKLAWDERAFHVLFPSHRTNTVKRSALALTAVEELKARGLRIEIHFLEGVPNSEVPVWMNASDSLLLTSAHEGSPTAVKEALACGLPVVSVDVGDVAERLDGIDGCHLAAPDPHDLANRLSLVHKANRRVTCREKVESLGLENIARRLAEFYEEVLKPTKAVSSGEPLSTELPVQSEGRKRSSA